MSLQEAALAPCASFVRLGQGAQRLHGVLGHGGQERKTCRWVGSQEREEKVKDKAQQLKVHGELSLLPVLVELATDWQEKYKDNFSLLESTYHPENLEEQHKDGSEGPEVRGKASNLKWAVHQAATSQVC